MITENNLLKHQKNFVNREIKTFNRHALFWEPGTGKTLSIISRIHKIFDKQQIDKQSIYKNKIVLILCPLSVVKHWEQEIENYNHHNKSVHCFLGTGDKKYGDLRKFKNQYLQDVSITSKLSFLIFNHDVLNVTKILTLLKSLKISFLVVDEAHVFKNHKSQRTNKLVDLIMHAGCHHRWILTGTPIANNEMDIYAPFYILLGNRSPFYAYHQPANARLYRTNMMKAAFYIFRAKYFFAKQKVIYSGGKQVKFYEFNFKPELRTLYNDNIAKYSSSIKKTEVVDLPARTFETRIFELNNVQKETYKKLKTRLVVLIKEKVAEVNNVSKYLRLQQITSGYLPVEDIKDKEIVEFKNERLLTLEQILIEYTNSRIIIWAAFRYDYSQIEALLNQHNISYVVYTGEQSAKHKEESLNQWHNDSNIQVFLGNPKSAGVGVNLQEADLMIYYSRDYSLINRLQSLERNYRIGTENKVHVIDIVAHNTIDEKVVQVLKKKEKINAELLQSFVLNKY